MCSSLTAFSWITSWRVYSLVKLFFLSLITAVNAFISSLVSLIDFLKAFFNVSTSLCFKASFKKLNFSSVSITSSSVAVPQTLYNISLCSFQGKLQNAVGLLNNTNSSFVNFPPNTFSTINVSNCLAGVDTLSI